MSTEDPHHLTILTNYLVRPCPGNCINKSKCLFYHSDSDKRRIPYSPSGLNYTDVICPSISKSLPCSDSCLFSHNFSEMIYHPYRYKTQWCDQSNCKGPFLCHQSHKPNERLRLPGILPISPSPGPVFSSHLDLSTFKTVQCGISEVHNQKLCFFYHSNMDRRRLGIIAEMCEKKDCDGECKKAHNRVEMLYHPEKYKNKFCSFYPDRVVGCDYAGFCSFAHSESDIKIELIHNYQKSMEFYMRFFKTVWCPFILQHDKATCVYAHNWQDYRRRPDEVNYESLPCSAWKASNFILSYEEGGCKEQTKCRRCHGWKEIEYHPSTYKLKPCNYGKVCPKQQDCPFYHSVVDKRSQDESPIIPKPSTISNTPHPQKHYLTPESAKSLPEVLQIPENVTKDQINTLNTQTEDFLLFRSKLRKPSKKNINELNFDNFSSPLSSPQKQSLKELDSRVTQFLSRHKLKHLADKFIGVKWEDLHSFHLDEFDDKFRSAWNEEQEDQEQTDELINNDIALFIGQKTGSTPDLKIFKIQDDFDEFVLTFPKAFKAPTDLTCPLTKKLMRDPAVFSLDGRTYERSAIILHINESYPNLEAEQLIRNLKSDKSMRQELLLRYS